MNPYYNYSVSSPHLFRSAPTRASYPQAQPHPQLQPYAAPNTNPLYSSVSRRSQGGAPPLPISPSNSYSPNYSTYTNPYYHSIPSTGHLPYYNSYPGQAFPSTLPHALPASYGLTAWPARHAIHSISDKGLEAILIAILILAALDLILVRPHKGNLLQRGE